MKPTTWYVVVPSAHESHGLSTLGPYVSRDLAERGALDSKAAHYEILEWPATKVRRL
ncbi:MAG TPA: hypothetical protein VGL44_01180 [Gaiellales bacterium]|jgi:hypothetical protein